MHPLSSKTTTSTTYLLTILLALFLSTPTLSSPSPAEPTLGPQGYASFASLPAFSTLKPCAQGCLKYNGVYVCGMAGWGDLGSKIGCGCSPQNYCLCDVREAGAVSSYIQSCVVTKCETPNEESAVLDLYNGYCQTANIPVSSTSSKPYTFTGSTPTDATSPPTSTNGSKSNNNLSAATAANTGTPGENGQGVQEKKPALGIGAIIGISVGGVVLLGALMCIGCCVFFRKRSRAKKAKKLAATQAQPIEPTYIPGKEGAAQIDGTGVFGAKPKVEEKVKPYVVSPLHTPTQGFAAPVVGQGQGQGQGSQVPNNGQHEMYASPHGQPQQLPNQQFPNQYQQQQQQQQQQYQQQPIPSPSPNHHEMYAHPQTPAQTAQELYTHPGNGNQYQMQTQHQQRGNWIAAQVGGDYTQGGQGNQYGYHQQSPVQLSAGQDGVRSGSRPVYEKP